MKNFRAADNSHAGRDEKHDINFHWPYIKLYPYIKYLLFLGPLIVFLSPLSERAIKATQEIPMKYPCMYHFTFICTLVQKFCVKNNVNFQFIFTLKNTGEQFRTGRTIQCKRS